jgi:hypothetical protein
MVEPDGPQMALRCICVACWITKTTHTHTLRICNTYCFSTATVLTRKRLCVTLCVGLHCFSFFSSSLLSLFVFLLLLWRHGFRSFTLAFLCLCLTTNNFDSNYVCMYLCIFIKSAYIEVAYLIVNLLFSKFGFELHSSIMTWMPIVHVFFVIRVLSFRWSSKKLSELLLHSGACVLCETQRDHKILVF